MTANGEERRFMYLDIFAVARMLLSSAASLPIILLQKYSLLFRTNLHLYPHHDHHPHQFPSLHFISSDAIILARGFFFSLFLFVR